MKKNLCKDYKPSSKGKCTTDCDRDCELKDRIKDLTDSLCKDLREVVKILNK